MSFNASSKMHRIRFTSACRDDAGVNPSDDSSDPRVAVIVVVGNSVAALIEKLTIASLLVIFDSRLTIDTF